jgi:hypothetical protein
MSYEAELLSALTDRVQDQSTYRTVVTGPSLETALDPVWDGFEVTTAGDVQVLTAANKLVTMPVQTGRIYPVAIKGIVSQDTTVSATDIIGYIE